MHISLKDSLFRIFFSIFKLCKIKKEKEKEDLLEKNEGSSGSAAVIKGADRSTPITSPNRHRAWQLSDMDRLGSTRAALSRGLAPRADGVPGHSRSHRCGRGSVPRASGAFVCRAVTGGGY